MVIVTYETPASPAAQFSVSSGLDPRTYRTTIAILKVLRDELRSTQSYPSVLSPQYNNIPTQSSSIWYLQILTG